MVKHCFSTPLPDGELAIGLQLVFTKDMMCKNAGVQIPVSAGVNETLPCDMTLAEYNSKMNGCSNKLLRLWQANKADPATCG